MKRLLASLFALGFLVACGDDEPAETPTTEAYEEYVEPELQTDPEPRDTTELIKRADGTLIECVFHYDGGVDCDWDTVIP